MAISNKRTMEDIEGDLYERPKRTGYRKGQGFGQTVAMTQKAIQAGGEHDLDRAKLPQALIDHIVENVSKPERVEYMPEFARQVTIWLSDISHCWTLRLLAASLGCSERTMYNWISRHNDFARAISYGKAIQEAHFGSILLQGFRFSKSVEYVLANLHDWSDKREETHKIIDLNKEIAEREEFAHSHRLRQKVDWRYQKAPIIDADIINASSSRPPAQIPALPPLPHKNPRNQEEETENIRALLANPLPLPEEERTPYTGGSII